MYRLCRLAAAVATVCYALALLSGCAKQDTRPARVPASGTLLRMGQPVAKATVIFEPVGSTPAAAGQTDAAGRFQLTTFDPGDGAVPGAYKVAVRKIELIRGERPAQAADDQAGPPPDEKWLLPVKYGYTSTSGLTAEVAADGTNDFKFELGE
jgi:hypothetical protein